MIKVNIVKNDIDAVAKAVIIDSKNRTLFLKRSSYVKKFAKEWDLPGGHLKENESLSVKTNTVNKKNISHSINPCKIIFNY